MKIRKLYKYCYLDNFEKITLGNIVDEWAELYKDKIAIKEGNKSITYEELAKESKILAGKLNFHGISKDDIVMLQCINDIRFVQIIFALSKIGAIPVLILPAYRENEIIKILKKTDAKFYIGPEEYMGYQYMNIANELKKEKDTITCFLVNQDFLKDEDFKYKIQDASVEYDDIAVLLLSGGTTGDPKLIPRTHADYIYNAKMSALRSGMNKNTIYLASLPIAHNMPLSSPGILGAFSCGGTVIMCSFPSPDEILYLIEKEKVTVTGLVPTVAGLCTDLLEYDDFDISSLKSVLIGGARMDEKLARNVMEKWGCIVQNQFGTAEGLITATSLNDSIECILTCQGKPISEGDDVKIISNDGVVLKKGEIGELIVKGPYTIEKYFNEPDDEKRFTQDGYYKTGDKAMINSDGNICILGRIKEIINRAGEKILPSEIEDVLLEIKEINKAVVIPVDDEELGQRSCAFIELNNDSELSKEEIRSIILKNNVIEYKIPDEIRFIKEWPVTKIGKIDSKRLREIAQLSL